MNIKWKRFYIKPVIFNKLTENIWYGMVKLYLIIKKCFYWSFYKQDICVKKRKCKNPEQNKWKNAINLTRYLQLSLRILKYIILKYHFMRLLYTCCLITSIYANSEYLGNYYIFVCLRRVNVRKMSNSQIKSFLSIQNYRKVYHEMRNFNNWQRFEFNLICIPKT